MTIEAVLEMLSNNSHLTYLQGECSEKMILEAESELGSVFPCDYRRFIERFGAGFVGDLEIFGVVAKNPNVPAMPNVVWLNVKWRARNVYPDSAIVIGQSPDGYVYHVSVMKDVIDCPVYLSPPHNLSLMEKVGARFADFLATLIMDALDNEEEQ